MDTTKNKITKDTIIAEALESSEKAPEILQDFIGSSCMACGGRFFETIEMALSSHGREKELEATLKKLNEAISK